MFRAWHKYVLLRWIISFTRGCRTKIAISPSNYAITTEVFPRVHAYKSNTSPTCPERGIALGAGLCGVDLDALYPAAKASNRFCACVHVC